MCIWVAFLHLFACFEYNVNIIDESHKSKFKYTEESQSKEKNLFDILLICIISVQNSQINCIYIYRFAAIEFVLFNMGK